MRKSLLPLIAVALSALSVQAQTVGPQTSSPYSQAYTPVVTFAVQGDNSVSYSVQSGRYTRVSPTQICYISTVSFTPTYTTASGALQISLPVAGGAFSQVVELQLVTAGTVVPVGVTATYGFIEAGASNAIVEGFKPATGGVDFTATNFVSGNSYNVRISGCYFTG